MSHHLRRILVVSALFIGAGLIYQVWRQHQPGYGLFDLLRGRPDRLAVVGAPGLSEGDVSSMAQFSEESMKLCAAVLPAVVSINADQVSKVPVTVGYLSGYRYQLSGALGSGVIINKEGYVVTNNHVIANAAQIKITTADGKEHDAEFIGANEGMDVAVLRIVGGKDFPTLSFANSDEVRVGQLVFAVGNPFGLNGTVTHGIISATKRQVSDGGPYLLQTDTVINPGNSGGPLVNVRGEIVGINVALYAGPEQVHTWAGVGLTIPSNEVKAAADAIIKSAPPGGVAKGYLGLQFNDSLQMAGMDNFGRMVAGAQVARVDRGSPAEKAGFQPGDIVVQFGDRTIGTVDEMRAMIARSKPGIVASIVVSRNGLLHTLIITMGRK